MAIGRYCLLKSRRDNPFNGTAFDAWGRDDVTCVSVSGWRLHLVDPFDQRKQIFAAWSQQYDLSLWLRSFHADYQSKYFNSEQIRQTRSPLPKDKRYIYLINCKVDRSIIYANLRLWSSWEHYRRRYDGSWCVNFRAKRMPVDQSENNGVSQHSHLPLGKFYCGAVWISVHCLWPGRKLVYLSEEPLPHLHRREAKTNVEGELLCGRRSLKCYFWLPKINGRIANYWNKQLDRLRQGNNNIATEETQVCWRGKAVCRNRVSCCSGLGNGGSWRQKKIQRHSYDDYYSW